MRRLFAVIALIAGALAPAIGASVPSASAATSGTGLGVRLVDAPTNARNDPRARAYIVDRLAPGAVIHRRIEVSNGTAKPLQASVYAAAATISNGSFLGAAARTPDELSTWMSVSPATPKLAAGAKKLVMVTVTVPKDASPGERYAVVWAEVRSAAPKGAGVTQVSRVGIRLYLSIGPGGAPAANFAITALTAQRTPAGAPAVVATVRNTGGRAIDMSGSLRLTKGPGGLSAGPFPAVLGTTLAPGQQEPVRIALDKQLPAGPWAARITLTSGLISRNASAVITFPAKGSAAPVKATATTASSSKGWLLPTVVVGLALLALAGVGVAVLRRRGGPPTPGAPTPERELTPTG